jgi:E3 ubiquitin-protein ligase BRE1
MINLPDEIVRHTPAFKRLKAEVAHATLELERVRALLETTQKEADDLRERQEEFRAKIAVSTTPVSLVAYWVSRTLILNYPSQAEITKRLEDMEKKLASKDADVTRIRATREEARSELHELKSRDVEKMKQVAQIRTLANSRQDRINALSSEVRRLKMRLAADAGDRNAVDFLATNEEIDIAKALQERVK